MFVVFVFSVPTVPALSSPTAGLPDSPNMMVYFWPVGHGHWDLEELPEPGAVGGQASATFCTCEIGTRPVWGTNSAFTPTGTRRTVRGRSLNQKLDSLATTRKHYELSVSCPLQPWHHSQAHVEHMLGTTEEFCPHGLQVEDTCLPHVPSRSRSVGSCQCWSLVLAV